MLELEAFEQSCVKIENIFSMSLDVNQMNNEDKYSLFKILSLNREMGLLIRLTLYLKLKFEPLVLSQNTKLLIILQMLLGKGLMILLTLKRV